MIIMENATVELAREMIQRSRTVNFIQTRVRAENLRRRPAQWRQLQNNDVFDFPILDLQYLHFTYGIYQINLASSYIQDTLDRNGDEELHIDENINEREFIRLRIYSRF